ncbi:MAG: bifunctional phosphopantothenoylcysteine decarboxylase/phosphopantothenate--cysteine ligase CoaBC [Nitrospinota bacterium]|nr:bifunctional phosphopantothenoylcysteine decarboxylase/phosphopantothenate--cysteine ligase CoaBC [Nitrospinota bacterium]
MSLKDKKIILGVCGGIAAYKAVELLRLLMREGALVYVAMSANASRFVTPLTFGSISGHAVYDNIFQSNISGSMEHIQAAESADFLMVAPASANMIGKMANGLADDALSTLFTAYSGPVIVAPAMNDKMYSNPAVQENIARLQKRGIEVLPPERGDLACGTIGLGRLPEPEKLVEAVKKRLSDTRLPSQGDDLSGLTFLVTAGPTQEPLDPIRYITNSSSGKMGYAIAERARARGASVFLVSGPTQLPPPEGVKVLQCRQAKEMASHVLDHLHGSDVVVMTAAVADFSPEKPHKEKIKKQAYQSLVLNLSRTPDILMEIAKHKTRQVVVGFAAETQDWIQNALKKLKQKKLDMVVANDVSIAGNGFQSDFNQVSLIRGEENIRKLPKLPKKAVADILLDDILKLMAEKDTEKVEKEKSPG